MQKFNFGIGAHNSFSHIYTPLTEIKEELQKRRRNKELMQEVKRFFGSWALPEMEKDPKAVLSRTIATPNMELCHFLDLAEEVNLDPLLLEYPDKFVAKNLDKYHLCKLYFNRKTKNKSTFIADTLKIVDFNANEGRMFTEIDTVWGEKIIDVHHRVLYATFPILKNKVIDFTPWFSQTRHLTKYYYLYFLSLFVCNGVLFENFLTGDKEESSFINEKLLPSFKEVEDIFGVKPLIFPVLPLNLAISTYWYSYPESMEKNWYAQLHIKEL